LYDNRLGELLKVEEGDRIKTTTTNVLVVGLVALGFCVVRFGMAMKDLEQRVSDMQERIDRAPVG
jgi:hypothetical protein